MSLRDRCKAFYEGLQRANVNANFGSPIKPSPVDDLRDFVISEQGRAADKVLEPSAPLVLYFHSEKDREHFIDMMQVAKPNMLSRRWPR